MALQARLKQLEEASGRYIYYWGYIGIMEKKMETTIVYWGYMRLQKLVGKIHGPFNWMGSRC